MSRYFNTLKIIHKPDVKYPLIKRIICFFAGHNPWKDEWKTRYESGGYSRKGKQKRKMRYRTTNKHYQITCQRCGKILDKR